MSGKYASRLNCEIKDYSVCSLYAASKMNLGAERAFETTTDTRMSSDVREFDVYLRCRREDSGFDFDCSIEGSFVFHEPITPSNARLAWVNGCTILYGIVRGIYATASAQCVRKPLVLPAAMMVDVVDRRIDELKKLTNEAKPQPRKPRLDGATRGRAKNE